MPAGPPRAIAFVIGLLIPPACRQEVLGDLHERYAGNLPYIVDALHAVPYVILSRIRRTTDPAVLLMEALALYLSFLVGAWYIDRALLGDQWGLSRLAIPVVVALAAMVLRDAYATPGVRLRWEAVLRPMLGAGCAMAVEARWVVVWGGVLSVLLISTLRLAFPPASEMPRGAGGPPFWQRYVTGPLKIRPPMLRYGAAIVAVVLLWTLAEAFFFGRL